MLEQLEGSLAVAETIGACGPDVIAAYAIDLDNRKGCEICAQECPCGAIEKPEEI